MKLYYAPGACSLASHIALIEAGLPFKLEKIDLKTKKTETGANFLSVNPKGYVPALVLDDGAVLTENVAILSYIGAKAPKLMPAEGLAHWRALEMLAFISTEVHKSFKPIFDPSADEAARKAAQARIGSRLAFLADAMGGNPFVLGADLSVADCYLFVMLSWALAKGGIDVPPSLRAYHERLKKRPAFAQALKEEGLA
ncbi:glutathione transferase GstA [Methylocella sp.]|uniref:glutathione transferase GstA n=1 Tax=Methylocella sp. TaxID=1978226 RepID=UPI0035AFF5DE